MNILLTWLGSKDVEGLKQLPGFSVSPIATILADSDIDLLICLLDEKFDETLWKDELVSLKPVKNILPARVKISQTKVKNPTDYARIFDAAEDILAAICAEFPEAQLFVNTSSGTPSMQTVWVCLSFKYPLTLLQTSMEAGLEIVELPFALDYTFPNRPLVERLNLASRYGAEISAIDEIPGSSGAIREAKQIASKYALLPFPKLITGETGTGKEVFANAIHKTWSLHNSLVDAKFLPLNCGAIPESLIDTELFGYKKGAFTDAKFDKAGIFEECDGGTVFLDEIAELPLTAQTRLLRVLQEGKVRRVGEPEERAIPQFHLVAATHKDLRKMIGRGEFREDLYQRIAWLPLKLPPLRDRKEDLRSAMLSILDSKGVDVPELRKEISETAMGVAERHSWPGNFRELESTLIRAAIFAETGTITAKDLSAQIQNFSVSPYSEEHADGYLENALQRALSKGLDQVAEEFQGELCIAYRQATGSTQAEAAKLLQTSQPTISRSEQAAKKSK